MRKLRLAQVKWYTLGYNTTSDKIRMKARHNQIDLPFDWLKEVMGGNEVMEKPKVKGRKEARANEIHQSSSWLLDQCQGTPMLLFK